MGRGAASSDWPGRARITRGAGQGCLLTAGRHGAASSRSLPLPPGKKGLKLKKNARGAPGTHLRRLTALPRRSWEPPGAPAPQGEVAGPQARREDALSGRRSPNAGVGLTPTSQGRKVRRPRRVLNPGLWSRGTHGWRGLLPLDPEGGKETHEAPQDNPPPSASSSLSPPGEDPQVRGDGHGLQALTARRGRPHTVRATCVEWGQSQGQAQSSRQPTRWGPYPARPGREGVHSTPVIVMVPQSKTVPHPRTNIWGAHMSSFSV